MTAIRAGVVRFPLVGEGSIAWHDLFEQLLAWRPDVPVRFLTQDLVMSLWFCYLRWRQLRDLVDADLSPWKRRGSPSITLYAGAHTNVTVEGADRPKAPVTYEQVWSELANR